MSKTATHWANVVGQSIAKETIDDILLSSELPAHGGFIAPFLIVAPKGIGKTKVFDVVKGIIKQVLKRRILHFRDGSHLGNREEFFEKVVPAFSNKDAVFLIDEVHNLERGMQATLRTMLETKVDRGPLQIQFGDKTATFNPSLNTIIAATNRVDKVDPALLSRFERIDLLPYTDGEMEQILFQGLGHLHFHESSLRAIATCNRGNARDVIHWINAVNRHVELRGKKTINRADVADIIRKKGVYPLGVTHLELRTLLALEMHGDQQLKELANKNQCARNEQEQAEGYLLQRGLIFIEGKRKLTKLGREYLAALRKEKFIPDYAVRNSFED